MRNISSQQKGALDRIVHRLKTTGIQGTNGLLNNESTIR
jgi:hypothetical protein